MGEKIHPTKGKQSIKTLVRQGQGVSSIPLADEGLKDFQKIAKKYGVDFAVVKDKKADPPVYTIFFKAKDMDVITKILQDYADKQVKKGSMERPSVLEKLKKFKEIVAAIPRKSGREKEGEGAMNMKQLKKQLILNIPYIVMGLAATNLGEMWRLAVGANASEKVQSIVLDGLIAKAFSNPLPSFYPTDLLVGIACGAALRLAVYLKGKNAKKFRHNEEYGSARWGKHADIEPFEDPVFANNVILSQTERITMSSRPKIPKYARNKNVLVVGGSGSGKTRFFIKPNLLQMHSSYGVTDPKGGLVNEIRKCPV